MGSSFGKNIKISLFGESHSYCVGLTIEGLKAGIYIDQEYLEDELKEKLMMIYLLVEMKKIKLFF